MQPIPGSAIEFAGSHAGPEHLEIIFDTTHRGPRFWEQPRWDEFKTARGYDVPMTPARCAGIARKRKGVVLLKNGTAQGGGVDGAASKKNKKPKSFISECVTGAELLAGYASGKLFPYPLASRRTTELVPTSAKWNMRFAHDRVVSVFAGAIIGQKKRGVAVPYRELAALRTKSRRSVLQLKDRQLGTVIRELVSWGLLRATPVFVPYGRVTSQRANVYQLTTLAQHVFGLKFPPECLPLPDPDPDAFTPGVKTPSKANPVDRQELPANPETPLRGISSEEHAAFQRCGSPSNRGVGEAADTAPRADSARCMQGTDSRASAATFSGDLVSPPTSDVGASVTTPAQPGMPPETRHLVGRRAAPGFVPPLPEAEAKEQRATLLLPSTAENAPAHELVHRPIGSLIPSVVARKVVDRKVGETVDNERTGGASPATATNLNRAKGREVYRERHEIKQRQAEQLELVRSRQAENERQRDRRGSRGVDFEDDELAPSNGVPDPELLERLRRFRESERDEARERRYNMNAPVRPPRPDPDADFFDVIKSAWNTRFGGMPIVVEVNLDKKLGGKS